MIHAQANMHGLQGEGGVTFARCGLHQRRLVQVVAAAAAVTAVVVRRC
jgi:hypothetical protein